MEVEHADFLKWPVEAWAASAAAGLREAGGKAAGAGRGGADARLKVVANLPFNITTEALARLLPLGRDVGSIYLLLQEEAARRLAQAQPDDKDYRSASVKLRFFGKPRYVLSVSRVAFFPEAREKRPDELGGEGPPALPAPRGLSTLLMCQPACMLSFFHPTLSPMWTLASSSSSSSPPPSCLT